jgi:hypothetical protein
MDVTEKKRAQLMLDVPSSRSRHQIDGAFPESKVVDDELKVSSVLVRLVGISRPAERRVLEADVVGILVDYVGGLRKVSIDELGVVKELVDPLKRDVWSGAIEGQLTRVERTIVR